MYIVNILVAFTENSDHQMQQAKKHELFKHYYDISMTVAYGPTFAATVGRLNHVEVVLL